MTKGDPKYLLTEKFILKYPELEEYKLDKGKHLRW